MCYIFKKNTSKYALVWGSISVCNLLNVYKECFKIRQVFGFGHQSWALRSIILKDYKKYKVLGYGSVFNY